MKFLLIDTSSLYNIYGLSEGKGKDEIVSYLSDGKSTSSSIMEGIDDVLHSTDVSELDKIFVVCGPGSFTGIRIGVAVALGIGYANNIEVIGLSAFNGFSPDAVKAIPSRTGYYYYSKDGIEGEIDEESLLKEENVECIAKDTPFKYIRDENYACNLMLYAWSVIEGKEKGLPPEPYYLKKCQAERMLDLKKGKKSE